MTINRDEILKQKYDDKIEGYKCEKCSQTECKLEKTIKPKSEVLIVHINRFEHIKGVAKKLLSTQKIVRKFLDYELQGIIFHFGRDV